jgi:SAM-dependent methyltransferase
METNKYGRLKSPVEEIEVEELKWWQKNAFIEDKFCWVQPIRYQKFLRGDYVKYLKRKLKLDSKILELGCGTGWLLFLLLDSGFKDLHGIDFSSKQIQIANERRSKLSNEKQSRLDFDIGGFELLKVGQVKFDVIICHGFLHHLTELEIKETLKTITNYLNPEGLLLIWEPFIYTRTIDRVYQRFQYFKNLFSRGQRWGRKFSEEELKFRYLIDNRFAGKQLRGPSPKEIPFNKEELKELLSTNYEIINERKLMSFSHLIAQELLLTSLSYPTLIRLIEWPILLIAKLIEKRVLSRSKIDSPFWIFELIECKRKEEQVQVAFEKKRKNAL